MDHGDACTTEVERTASTRLRPVFVCSRYERHELAHHIMLQRQVLHIVRTIEDELLWLFSKHFKASPISYLLQICQVVRLNAVPP